MIRSLFSKYTALAGLAALMLALAVTPSHAQSDDDHEAWAPGTNWMSIRGGYAKSSSENAGNGSAGFGFGYSRMLGESDTGGWRFFNGSALSFNVHYDIVGSFGRASEITVPATVEFLRHFNWSETFRPYLGLGGGVVYRKTYRTGEDLRTVKPSYLFVVGANAPINRRHMLGLDVRLMRVDGSNEPANPVFGPGSFKQTTTFSGGVPTVETQRETTHWSVKLAYSVTY